MEDPNKTATCGRALSCLNIEFEHIAGLDLEGSSLITPLKKLLSVMQRQGKPQLRVHAAANFVELFEQTIVVLQTSPARASPNSL
ncbi:hypothetical protein TNCV_3630761 [Trichonephila clavipes]|nr:hypothetical protein TNCV_3630761 [Trichonephila clavipes]